MIHVPTKRIVPILIDESCVHRLKLMSSQSRLGLLYESQILTTTGTQRIPTGPGDDWRNHRKE